MRLTGIRKIGKTHFATQPEKRSRWLLFLVAALTLPWMQSLKSQEGKTPKEVAGKADVLRNVKKHFAVFESVEGADRVRLQLEGLEGKSSTWAVLPDAEIKINGSWGRVEQLVPGDRVWVWLSVNRERKPVAILMLADEVSEQDIHGQPITVQDVQGDSVTVHIPDEKKVPSRILKRNGHDLKAGDVGYLQTSGDSIRRFLGKAEFEKARAEQRDWLRARWREEGLPGMVSFLHPMSGEMEVMLDHEAMRWGRYQKKGSPATLDSGRESKAHVMRVEPWRERTRLVLVTGSGLDQLDLVPGQRIKLKVGAPPAEIEASDFPTDIGRREGAEARIEWFLSTIYCPCGIAGDRCTGMFYTLGSCNAHACGAPDEFREIIAELIGKGLDDRKIYEQISAERGPDVVRQHLLR